MPVCPQCSANIHAGALLRCPACGYCMQRAESVFGSGRVEFTRVVDAAGALKQQDLEDLMRYLENLERNLPPVALCVYITDHGSERELRPLAHWILNHAGIHHPSFGKRELRKAVEDAALREDLRDKNAPAREDEGESGFLHAAGEVWQALRDRVRNAVRPYAAPVKMEWALILVMDVQLELACFSWGYRLDPYINPERINQAIISARLQFRERATAQGIKKVMRNAVRIIASDSRAVSRRIRKEGKVGKPVGVETMPEIPAARKAARLLLPAMLGLSLAAASAPVAMAANTQKSPPKSTQRATQQTTQKTARKSPQRTKAATKAATKQADRVTKPAARRNSSSSSAKKRNGDEQQKKNEQQKKDAQIKEDPEPVQEDKAPLIVPATLPNAAPSRPRLPDAPTAHGLMDDDIAEEVENEVPEVDVEDTPPPAGEAAAASFDSAPRWKPEDYTLLMKGSLQTGYTALFPAKGETAARRPAAPADKTAPMEESDSKVLGRYCPEYSKPSPLGLIDPQGLLSTPERGDVEHLLRDINRNGKFRVYAAVVKAGQELPGDLAVGTLATAAAQPCEYAVLLLYYIGAPASLELGYQEIKADDAQRHEWLNKVRSAAAACGTGPEGLRAALRQAADNIAPLANSFRPLTLDNSVKAPKLDIPFKQEEEVKEPGFQDKWLKKIQDPDNVSFLPYLGGAFAVIAAFILAFIYRRHHSPTLLDTTPDWRLYAPYGSGVSRLVKYLEGKESDKEKALF